MSDHECSIHQDRFSGRFHCKHCGKEYEEKNKGYTQALHDMLSIIYMQDGEPFATSEPIILWCSLKLNELEPKQ